MKRALPLVFGLITGAAVSYGRGQYSRRISEHVLFQEEIKSMKTSFLNLKEREKTNLERMAKSDVQVRTLLEALESGTNTKSLYAH